MTRVLIVPAAGPGSRLGLELPKVLAPVAGRAMIDHVLDLYAEWVDRVVVVLHPEFVQAVREHCAGRALPIEYDLQPAPTGMLDAILIPRERLRVHRPRSIWVTWCDQIAVHSDTIAAVAALSARCPDTPLILPTVERHEPYVHFVRNPGGAIVDVRHRREADAMPALGESDVGLFCLSPRAYFELLPRYAGEIERGAQTGERNFIPFIPWLERREAVKTVPARDEIESVGINTLDDLRRVEAYLHRA